MFFNEPQRVAVTSQGSPALAFNHRCAECLMKWDLWPITLLHVKLASNVPTQRQSTCVCVGLCDSLGLCVDAASLYIQCVLGPK